MQQTIGNTMSNDSLKEWSNMLAEITRRTESGDIIGGAIQYMTSDGSIWMKTVDGDFQVPADILDEANMTYSRLTGKGN